MDSYKIQIFLHVGFVIVAMGVTFVYPFLQAFAEKRGVAAARFAVQFSMHLEKFVVLPGAILLFVFGLGLIFDDATNYNEDMPAWLWVSIAWYVVAFVVAQTLQRKNLKDALAALEGVPDTAPLPAAYTGAAKRLQIVGGLLGLSVIAITFLMTWQPWE